MRLVKYLARAGVASRRKSEEIIAGGRVRVNGTVTTLPQADVTAADLIEVDGVRIKEAERKYYLLLDKPPGFLSTVTDTHARGTVMDLVGDIPARLYPVGRLDADTLGVLLLTNDGELAYRLTHPRYKIEKTYRAWVKEIPSAAALVKMARGLELDGRITAPAVIRLVKTDGSKRAMLEITITEGRKRQVKQMCAALGHPVLKLRRVSFAFLTARGLRSGECRYLTRDEVRRLYRLVGLAGPVKCQAP